MPPRGSETEADGRLKLDGAEAVIEDEEARVGLPLLAARLLVLKYPLDFFLVPGLVNMVFADDAGPLAVELRGADDEDPSELAGAGQAVEEILLEVALPAVPARDEGGQVRRVYLEGHYSARLYIARQNAF